MATVTDMPIVMKMEISGWRGCKAGDALVFYHMVYEADPIVLTGIDQPNRGSHEGPQFFGQG